MGAGMSPFDKHPAVLGDIETQAAKLETLSNKAIDLNLVTNAAFKPAEASWDGVAAPELRAAPEPVRRSAQETSGALAWAAVPLRYWKARLTSFNSDVDRITGDLATEAANDYGAQGTDGAPPTGSQIASARATARAQANTEYWSAYDTYITQGASTAAGMFTDGPTEENLAAARDVGAIGTTPGVFTVFPVFWHQTNMEQLAREATELARTFSQEGYEPTEEELNRLRTILGQYASDEAFAYNFLIELGPRGLLQLNGQIATLQLSWYDAANESELLFDPGLAATMAAIQGSLGVALATATQQRGGGGYPGMPYNPGRYELSSDWLVELMQAGRDKFDIGYPSSPMRYQEDVYGYQLLAPLLNEGNYSARFLSMVGGDMVDFEMDEGGSEVWEQSRGENLRLDWTNGYDRRTPAGYDPMIPLMEALHRNPEGAKDLLTGMQVFSSDTDSPSGGRLPRLDYLLTDREWFLDVPGGPAYTSMLMEDDHGVTNPGLNRFGEVLERATLGYGDSVPDERSRMIVESIVYEYGVDEQMRGYENGERDGNAKRFEQNQVINPVLEDSMANIVKGYIWDVNRSMSNGETGMPGGMGAEFRQEDITRFLAHLGKDENAHETIRQAQAAYTLAAYDYYLNGEGAAGDDLDARIRSAQAVADRHGAVLGAIDFGATAANHQTTLQADEAHNNEVKGRYAVANFLVDQVMGQATSRIPIPVVGDVATSFVDGILSEADAAAMHNNIGSSDYDIGSMLTTGRLASADLAVTALYQSGQLADLPPELLNDGRPVPMSQWDGSQVEAWNTYVSSAGQDTVGFLIEESGGSYDDGHDRAQSTLRSVFG